MILRLQSEVVQPILLPYTTLFSCMYQSGFKSFLLKCFRVAGMELGPVHLASWSINIIAQVSLMSWLLPAIFRACRIASRQEIENWMNHVCKNSGANLEAGK